MATLMEDAARHYSRREYRKALDALRGAEIPEGEEASWAYYMGLCYARLGEWEDALLYLEQVVTGVSGVDRMVQCRLLLAWIYTVTGRFRLAEYELREIEESGQGDDPRMQAAMAYLDYRQGRVANAIERYEKALEASPTCATALNSLGYILADAGKDLKRALGLIRKALDIQPENPAYLDSLGWALHRSGFSERGRLYLEKARRLSPRETEIISHMEELGGIS